MSSYKYSTQAKYWLYTVDKVDELLRQRYHTTVERIQKLYNQIAEEIPTASTVSSTSISPLTVDSSSNPSTVHTPSMGSKRRRSDDDNVEDAGQSKRGKNDTSLSVSSSSPPSSLYVPFAQENLLLQWSGRTIFSICYNHCNFDPAIACTAVVYLQRYYLHHTLLDYAPTELIMAAILLAIKTESCPYTEVIPFTQLLSIIDKEWFILFDYTLLHYSSTVLSNDNSSTRKEPLNATATTTTTEKKNSNNDDDDDSSSVNHNEFFSHRISTAYSSSSTDTSMLRNEVPLVTGIQFHLQIHHPHTVAKTLLTECIQAYIHVFEGTTLTPSAASLSSSLSSSSFDLSLIPNLSQRTFVNPDTQADEFRKAWNHYQQRIMGLCDLICTTTAIFIATPAQLALATLIVAGNDICMSTSTPSPIPTTTTLISTTTMTQHGHKDNASVLNDFVQYVTPSKRFEGLLTPVSTAIAWFIPYFIRFIKQKYGMNTSSTSASTASTVSATTETILNQCVTTLESSLRLSSPELTGKVLETLQILHKYKDLSYRPGTTEYQIRLSAIRKAKELYMQTKYRNGHEATQTFLLQQTTTEKTSNNNNNQITTTTATSGTLSSSTTAAKSHSKSGNSNIEIEFEG